MTAQRANVTMFTTGPECTLCEATWGDLVLLGERLAFDLESVDLRDRRAPEPDYLFRAPVVHVDGSRVAEGRIDRANLERVLRLAGVPGR